MSIFKTIVLVSLVLAINISANEKCSITYKPYIFHAVDSFPAFGACMTLTDESGTIGKIADMSGMFNFENIKPGKYLRKITSIEYIKLIDTVLFGNNNGLYSDTTYLKRKSVVRYMPTPKRPGLELERFLTPLYSYSGYVLSKTDSLPFHGATIKIADSLGAASNTDGYFIIKNLQRGIYPFTLKCLEFEGLSDTLTIDSLNVVDTFYLDKIIKYITPIEDFSQKAIMFRCSPLILTGKSYFVAFRKKADSTNIKSIINCSFMDIKLTGNGRYYFEGLNDIKYKLTIQLPQYNFPTVFETVDVTNIKDYKTQTFYFDNIDTASIIVNFEIDE